MNLLNILRRISKLPVIKPIVLIMTLLVLEDKPVLCHITDKTIRSSPTRINKKFIKGGFNTFSESTREDFIAQVFGENIENHSNFTSTRFLLSTVILFIIV